MMKNILFTTLLLLSASYSNATTYICQVNGSAVFSTEKINKSCQVSQMNGISEQSASEASTESQTDSITHLWEKQQFGMYDDIKIVVPSKGSVTNTAEASNPKLNIRLRNGKTTTSTTTSKRNRPPVKAAPIIAAPPPKPQLSRKKILQNEIRNEKAALVRAKAELNVAKKKGDATKINRLTQAVKDREANIRAIQNEMNR